MGHGQLKLYDVPIVNFWDKKHVFRKLENVFRSKIGSTHGIDLNTLLYHDSFITDQFDTNI